MASYLSQAGVSTLWAKIKSWTKDTFTTAKLVLTGYSKSYMGTINATDTINAAISKLETGLDGKAATGHTHTKAQITDFAHDHDDRYYTETEVDTKLGGKANTGHTHTLAQVDGLQTALNGKAASSHTHSFGEIVDSEGTDLNDTLENIENEIAGKANTGHTHAMSDITNLTTTLSGKVGAVEFNKLTNRVSALEGTAATGMNFKGTLGTGAAPEISAVPAGHKKGDCYVVSTAGTYAGVQCEVGDMVVCNASGTTPNNAHWTVIQANLSPLTESEINAICV